MCHVSDGAAHNSLCRSENRRTWQLSRRGVRRSAHAPRHGRLFDDLRGPGSPVRSLRPTAVRKFSLRSLARTACASDRPLRPIRTSRPTSRRSTGTPKAAARRSSNTISSLISLKRTKRGHAKQLMWFLVSRIKAVLRLSQIRYVKSCFPLRDAHSLPMKDIMEAMKVETAKAAQPYR